MIQELLGGGAGLIGGERKISMNGVVLEGTPSASPSPSPSSSINTTTTATATTTTSSTSESQNLRCPRCDSSNTKFCYYNNYNLTQPRHFCKTCRRYWTKGGALRNVPIGGGCRKNKNTSVAVSSVGKSSAGKVKTTLSSEIGKSGLGNGFDHEIPSNPILWASPQNSHLMALLRATQNPNHNPNPNPMSNSVTVKEEGVMLGSHMGSESLVATGALNARNLGQDPSIGLCSSFWRNSQHQSQQNHHQHHQHQHHQQQNNGFVLGDIQNSSGIQELYQRLRSSANYYSDHSSPVILSNVGSSSSSSILESAPVAGGELGYWNSAYSWSDLPTTNGAYP